MKLDENTKITLTVGQLKKLVRENLKEAEDSNERRVKQISFDVVLSPESEDEALDEFAAAIENVANSLPNTSIVGGPEFTDASWSLEEYGL